MAARYRSFDAQLIVATNALDRLPTGVRGCPNVSAVNETATNPTSYGEPFVKRHGLESVTLASRHDVVVA
ncbi:hypothetical protein [Rhodopseudomonas palustris]|uniref:hypothetical protein n=1 Tax=Rhodopseudomonas palustris TaxID=1076 RepID=UPI0012EE93D1|nr:hypothetical protein [Rhodopseudomonas palustris]